VGTALAARAIDAAAALGCRVVDAEVKVGGPGEPFFTALGGESKLVAHRNVCPVEAVERSRLEGWVATAAERAGDYSLVAWDGPCPDARLDAFVDLRHVMNTAPMGDMDWEDEKFTAEEWRAMEESWAARGMTVWTLCARHDPSDDLVGFTQITTHQHWPQYAEQGDTGVWPEHRGRGLARWLKAVNALRLLDECPELRVVETGNAVDNDPMLSINWAMGFQPLDQWAEWQAPTTALLDAVRQGADARGGGASV
jgi:mycothiol synthase